MQIKYLISQEELTLHISFLLMQNKDGRKNNFNYIKLKR